MQVNGEMTMRLLAGELRTIDLTPRLGAIRCPTLILAGEDDPACPAEAAAEMASMLPAQLVRFRTHCGCGTLGDKRSTGSGASHPARVHRVVKLRINSSPKAL
jgi:fermentation-respiration switch protein FrsA (DUF1100 family)